MGGNRGRVRRLALSMFKQDDSIDGGTETKRLRAGWDSDYLEHLLRQLWHSCNYPGLLCQWLIVFLTSHYMYQTHVYFQKYPPAV